MEGRKKAEDIARMLVQDAATPLKYRVGAHCVLSCDNHGDYMGMCEGCVSMSRVSADHPILCPGHARSAVHFAEKFNKDNLSDAAQRLLSGARAMLTEAQAYAAKCAADTDNDEDEVDCDEDGDGDEEELEQEVYTSLAQASEGLEGKFIRLVWLSLMSLTHTAAGRANIFKSGMATRGGLRAPNTDTQAASRQTSNLSGVTPLTQQGGRVW